MAKFWIRKYDNGLGRVVFQIVKRGDAFAYIGEFGYVVEFDTRSKARNWIKGNAQ